MMKSISSYQRNTLILIVAAASVQKAMAGKIECTDNTICDSLLQRGSICMDDGFCSNPYQQGCLRTVLGSDIIPNKRACNSDDPADAAEKGLCEISQLNYDEIRIDNQDWDNPMVSAWVMQILLSEVLYVPTTIETGDPNLSYDFYDPRGAEDKKYVTYPYDYLRNAHEVGGDCLKIKAEYEETGEYRPCANVMPMVNKVGQRDSIRKLREDGIINQRESYSFFE